MVLTIYFIAMTVISFLMFAIDKRKAIKHAYRIPESALLLTAFLGGAFGSWMSMQLFHHKTQKTKFRILVPLAMVWTVGVVIWWVY
ncbi:DUF1294 domain-containing protein [Listeria ivanovii]|uniref:DUF1294 domain-containing protein n=2 Tax=Listeria ivanovii TaxID=1638 RepID=A0ABS1G3S7_LISIV|nr:DUF1294 domain-containing protein [Listeria ivanovii]EFR97631.1 cytochrome c oxidase, subunit IV, putative [Listeria ivanovii FSL F6-596]AIS59267.1 membrane protein [Listeria ivanovii subsp. londoniensis]AIS62101.1 membrane protein [Listeria ivanovii subsp. londoniensis]MBC2254928.1 DUF1294 domain-containing protein [Listeria ivanovii]MBK1961518.1 DUF1294 domain-containing protein [Listeria ivanovii subsp. londoniensis]